MRKPRGKKKPDNERHVAQLEQHLRRRGPGDEWHAPTPERVARANEAGQRIDPNIILTEAGNATGVYSWRITPIIDSLLKRGTLDGTEYDAALRYMRHYAGSRHKGPPTSRFLPHYDRGFQEMTPAERAIAMGQARAKAESIVHPFFRPCLRWLESAAEDETPLWQLGATYYPHLSKSAQSAKAPVILHFTLAMLADHYGLSHRFSYTEIEEAVRTMRITVEIEEKISVSRKKVEKVA